MVADCSDLAGDVDFHSTVVVEMADYYYSSIIL